MACTLAFALLATAHAVAPPMSAKDIKEEVAAMPEIPGFTQFFHPLPKLARRLRVCAPCTGIHGCGAALQGMETEADTFFVHDLEPGYESYLKQHLQSMGMQAKDILLKLGEVKGDLLKMPLKKLLESGHMDLLIAGPPCPPWAGQGLKRSTKDIRAKVFVRILLWAVVLIKSCGFCATNFQK